jgi:transposase
MSALTGGQIARLRAQGETVREIAAGLGVSTTTVYRWADPAYLARQNASQRRYKRRYPERARAARERYLERSAARCPRCGRPLASATAKGDPVLCGSCLSAATAERRRRINELAERGASPATIAARLGVPRGTVANDLHRLRARGELSPARPNGFGPDLERELIALYEDGCVAPRAHSRVDASPTTSISDLLRGAE